MKLSTFVRAAGTSIVLWLGYVAIVLYNAAMPSIQAKVAVGQVNDSIMQYSMIQAFIHSNAGKPAIVFLCVAALILIWWKPLKASSHTKPTAEQ